MGGDARLEGSRSRPVNPAVASPPEAPADTPTLLGARRFTPSPGQG
jgi:hypothetical protein